MNERHLHSVPPPTDRHLAAVERARRDIRPVRMNDQSLEAILHAINALPEDQKPDGRTYTTIAGEDGVLVRHCIACDGTHHTPWDRTVVDRDKRHDADTYVAWFGCPNQPGDKISALLDEFDFCDAIAAGAEHTPGAENEATVIHFRAWLEHPGVTATAIGRPRPTTGGDDAA